MSTGLVVAVTLVLFLSLLFSQLPVAFALAASGAVGLLLLEGERSVAAALATLPYSSSAKYALVLIPMFILMGVVISESGIASEVFDAVNRLLGRLPGGLAITTIAACTLLGGITGSSAADVATVGRVSMREMRRHGYPIRMAAAVVAAAGTIAILIPPSIVMVVFGILTGESIGQLLLAGIVPGIITALVFMTYCYLRLRKVSLVPAAVPAGGGATPPADDAEARPVPATGRAARIQAVAYCAVVFVVIIGGIYSGVFTANEAGAVGAFVAAVLAVVWTLSRRADPWSMLWTSLRETTVTTGMIFAILLGGGILSAFLVSAGVPSDLTRWVAQLDVPPLLVVVIILLLMLPLGMLLDGLSMLLITVPLTYPVVTDLGFNGVWFAVLVVIMIEIGLITPPVGINVFVVAGLHEEATVDDTFRGVLPFVLLDLGLIALFVAVPQIITTLPALVR